MLRKGVKTSRSNRSLENINFFGLRRYFKEKGKKKAKKKEQEKINE